jgi:hypothetical protein
VRVPASFTAAGDVLRVCLMECCYVISVRMFSVGVRNPGGTVLNYYIVSHKLDSVWGLTAADHLGRQSPDLLLAHSLLVAVLCLPGRGRP